jgi:hypothetical protein
MSDIYIIIHNHEAHKMDGKAVLSITRTESFM